MSDMFYANGVDIDSGTYAVEPLSPDALDALLRQEQRPENLSELVQRAATPSSLGTVAGIDVRDLAQAGWGVIFADDADPAVEQALKPLLDRRREQAGARYRCYSGPNGFRVGQDSKNQFLSRHGADAGPARPERVPYYLMIVGSPAAIPFAFQAQLDVQYAVGRLDLDGVAAYASYAESVVAAETGQVRLPCTASLVGVTHQLPDAATAQSRSHLVEPLAQALGAEAGWQLEAPPAAEAHRAALLARLGGSATPALLFTAGHGLQVPAGNRRGLAPAAFQGALVCADWPGPGRPIVEAEHCLAGGDLPRDANLLGLIACFFACFGGGTPREDAFSRLQRMRQGLEPGQAPLLSPEPFVAALPRQMLGAPGGGALAVIAHVERCWPSSFLWQAQADGTLPPQTGAFESTLRQLMRGYPVGAAVEFLNQKYAALAADLKEFLEAVKFGDYYDRLAFANTWMAANDAQWYTVIGDPAVQLPVDAAAAAPQRPALASVATPPAPEPPPAPAHAPAAPPDPRFDHPYTPAPAPTEELAQLKAQHPELYQSYVKHVVEGYENNSRIFDSVRRAFMRSHYSTVAMYWILFLLGVGTVVAGIVLAVGGQATAGAIFLGVGAAAFITYFVGRSSLSVEENLIYITWLGVIYNSYWTHLAWATQRETAQAELDKATVDAVAQLQRLLDRHARSVKGRPSLPIGDQPSPPAPPTS